jgi:adenylate cyclase
MAIEIERKFLVDTSLLEPLGKGARIVQGYLPTEGKTTVRARIKDEKAFLTLKGVNTGMSRLEFEYEIPVADAEKIISALCDGAQVEKTRYEIQHENHLWELDIFHGENDGLVVAEVELKSESETVSHPKWVTEEVTGLPQYYNANLLTNPYKKWRKS